MNLNLTMSFIFAVLLVLIGAPRSLLHDNTDKIAASAEDTATLTFAEALDDWNDDRLIGSHSLAFAVTTPHSFPVASSVPYPASDEVNSNKDNSRIYKLNSSFLI